MFKIIIYIHANVKLWYTDAFIQIKSWGNTKSRNAGSAILQFLFLLQGHPLIGFNANISIQFTCKAEWAHFKNKKKTLLIKTCALRYNCIFYPMYGAVLTSMIGKQFSTFCLHHHNDIKFTHAQIYKNVNICICKWQVFIHTKFIFLEIVIIWALTFVILFFNIMLIFFNIYIMYIH